MGTKLSRGSKFIIYKIKKICTQEAEAGEP
jgi:hypothetical protein